MALLGVSAVLIATMPLGCPPYRDTRVPNDIIRQTDPDTRNEYLLYVPSSYDRGRQWPLIVLCHGTRPWDTAQRQMSDWIKLAEERGFIVLAPELAGTSAFPAPPADEQIARQMEDESRILGAVRHVRGAYSISADRVFLTGWSAGSFAILYTGLRNPDIFRAITVQQGNFDPVLLGNAADRIDRHQPVSVIAGSTDFLTGNDARRCVDWLEDHHALVTELRMPGGHRGHPLTAVDFFERVIREFPWLHIRAFGVEGGDPLAVRFKTRGSFAPVSFHWQFGDGEESPVAEPIHVFPSSGTYRVTLTVGIRRGKTIERSIDLAVPPSLAAEYSTWDEP